MNSPSIWLAVGAGGALGAMARHGVSQLALRAFGPYFPWGTFIANVTGAFLMGVLIVWLSMREPASPEVRAFLSVGMLGAFTTFSTFSLDAVMLFRDKAYLAGGGYLLGSVALSIAGLLLGFAIARAVL
ncbi:MAG: fluoride efflux transporter CrcB [Pseudomonadota bacterium]